MLSIHNFTLKISSISQSYRPTSTSCNSHEESSLCVGHEEVNHQVSSDHVIMNDGVIIGSSSGCLRVLLVIPYRGPRNLYLGSKVMA